MVVYYIFVNDKKICGILTQGSFSLENQRAEYLIVGIGINIYPPREGFPRQIEDSAGYLVEKEETDLKNRLVAAILNAFWDLYKNYTKKEIIHLYREYSYILGKKVYIERNNKMLEVLAKEIDDDANLVVYHEDGQKEVLSSGEISIRI